MKKTSRENVPTFEDGVRAACGYIAAYLDGRIIQAIGDAGLRDHLIHVKGKMPSPDEILAAEHKAA